MANLLLMVIPRPRPRLDVTDGVLFKGNREDAGHFISYFHI
jgi:hypothetical protein